MVGFSLELRKILVMAVALIAFAFLIVIPIIIIKKITNKSKKPTNFPTVAPKDSPYISVEYIYSGALLDDGKCGWLDIECGFGGKETIELSFTKKTPNQFFVPLNEGQYRITYRIQSKATMAATGVLKTINESSGAMGAFANAVFDAGVGGSKLSTVVVNVDADFVMKLGCSTNGTQKNCVII